MGELRQATDAEVMGWTAAKYLEDYGEDAVITDLVRQRHFVIFDV